MSITYSEEKGILTTKMGHEIKVQPPWDCAEVTLEEIESQLGQVFKDVQYSKHRYYPKEEDYNDQGAVMYYIFTHTKSVDDIDAPHFFQRNTRCAIYVWDIIHGRMFEVFEESNLEGWWEYIKDYCEKYDQMKTLEETTKKQALRIAKLEAVIEHLASRSTDISELSQIVTEATKEKPRS